jgi:Cu+-exporting ATPase
VERALRKVPGVQDATVNLATESARIAYTVPDGTDACALQALLRRAVRNAGYEPRAADATDAPEDAIALGRLFAGGGGPAAVGAAGAAHGGRPVWAALDAAGLGAVSAGHAGAVHSGRALLQGRLAARSRR